MFINFMEELLANANPIFNHTWPFKLRQMFRLVFTGLSFWRHEQSWETESRYSFSWFTAAATAYYQDYSRLLLKLLPCTLTKLKIWRHLVSCCVHGCYFIFVLRGRSDHLSSGSSGLEVFIGPSFCCPVEITPSFLKLKYSLSMVPNCYLQSH